MTSAQLGTGAVILAWNDPLRVAEKMIELDILSGGRALFGWAGAGPGVARTADPQAAAGSGNG